MQSVSLPHSLLIGAKTLVLQTGQSSHVWANDLEMTLKAQPVSTAGLIRVCTILPLQVQIPGQCTTGHQCMARLEINFALVINM